MTARPSVVIRRHRLMQVTLDDLVAKAMLTPVVAASCAPASGPGGRSSSPAPRVRARRPWSGRCARDRPLRGDRHLRDRVRAAPPRAASRHKIVHAWEARPGSGERGADGRQAGEFTLDEALVDSFRFNLSRQIVGEVRGKEIWAMIKAMESGTGSISTTHAPNAVAAMRKLVTCAMEAGPHVTQGLATASSPRPSTWSSSSACETQPDGETAGQRTRRVAEIIAVAPGERQGLRDHPRLQRRPRQPRGHGRHADKKALLTELARHGFDLAAYQRRDGRYGSAAA